MRCPIPGCQAECLVEAQLDSHLRLVHSDVEDPIDTMDRLGGGFRDDVERGAWGRAYTSALFSARPEEECLAAADRMVLRMRRRHVLRAAYQHPREVLEERLRLIGEAVMAACAMKYEVVEGPDGRPVVVNDPLATLRELFKPVVVMREPGVVPRGSTP